MSTSVATPPLSAGTWTAEPVHTNASFAVRHMAFGKAKGRFDLKSAILTVGQGGVADASVTAVIDATSIDTKEEQRDGLVRSPDFLDVENHPVITFVSSGVQNVVGAEFVLSGGLTIRSITQPVDLGVQYLGETVDARGGRRARFSATASISRKAYGLSFEAAFGASNAVVADKVEIALELEFGKTAE
jgi:polyisoprenoid-binding protein YceI